MLFEIVDPRSGSVVATTAGMGFASSITAPDQVNLYLLNEPHRPP